MSSILWLRLLLLKLLLNKVRTKLIDLDRCFWIKSIFDLMGFVKRAATTSRPEIPDGTQREAELLLNDEIVSKVEEYKIP